MKWDVFISHASEDKEDIARPLKDYLEDKGVKVWLDEAQLKLGDSLREKIEEGLSQSRFGIVILSRSFFSKQWPRRELNGLLSIESNRKTRIIPIWHKIGRKDVAKYSPILADRLAVTTDESIDSIGRKIVKVVGSSITESANQRMVEVLELMRTNQLIQAKEKLRDLEKVLEGLSSELQLRVLYNMACIESLLSKDYFKGSRDCELALDYSCKYIERWLALGFDGAWEDTGRTARNEIYRMGCDGDLRFVFLKRRGNILRLMLSNFQDALPIKIPAKRSSGGGGGGCIPYSTLIHTPSGLTSIENLRVGDKILSLDIQTKNTLVARIDHLYSSQATECVCINNQFLFTPSQPLYLELNGWTKAEEIKPGMIFLDSKLNHQPVICAERVSGFWEIYDLITDHHSHNYLAAGFILHNKQNC